MSNIDHVSMHEFIICGTETFLKKSFSFEPSILLDKKYDEILQEIFVKKLPTIYRVLDENIKLHILNIYNKIIYNLIDKIDNFIKIHITSQLKHEILQIGLLKLKILHNIQKIIMFDEKKDELDNSIFEHFDLLQIKETFLKEKINISVEGFLKDIILHVPNLKPVKKLLLKICNELELGIDKNLLIKQNSNYESNKEIEIYTQKIISNRNIKIGETKMNCSEILKKNLSFSIKQRKFSKFQIKQENKEENNIVEQHLFELDHNFNIFQYIPRRVKDTRLSKELNLMKMDKKNVLDLTNSNKNIIINHIGFKCPANTLKSGINSRLALNMKFIPTLKLNKKREKNQLSTNNLKKHYKNYGTLGSDRSSLINKDRISDRSNFLSESNHLNKSIISSQKTDVLAFCTPLDVNFFKNKKTIHF